MQTLLIIIGVAAGVAVIAYVTALVNGLQANTVNKTLGTQAHISLRAPDDAVTPSWPQAPGTEVLSETQARAQRLRSVANWQALLPLLEQRAEVRTVSPMVSGSGLALRGEASQSIALMGVELARYERMTELSRKVVSGRLRLEPGEAVLGTELAKDLGLRVGDRFSVNTGRVTESMRVTALVDLGIKDLNRRTVIVPLRSAQSLLNLPGGATVIELQVHDVWDAERVAAQLRRGLPYKIESWQETNAQLVSALRAQSISTGVIRIVVAIVVVLGIASVLVVSVVQKQREIGILRAMGASPLRIMAVFLVQGGLYGLIGSLLGVLLSAGLLQFFSKVYRNADGSALFTVDLDPSIMLGACGIAMLVGLASAALPARRAAKMDPVQAIRM